MDNEEKNRFIEEIRKAVNNDTAMNAMSDEQIEKIHDLTFKPAEKAVETIREILRILVEEK